MTDLGYDQAIQMRNALMPIAYLLCTTGLIMAVFRHWGNFHEILMSIVGIGVIVILLNGYPTALTTVADGFKSLREQTTANAPGGPQATWTQIFQAQFEQPSWNQIAEKLEIALCQMFKGIGQLSIWFLDWVQSWAFNGLIAISPVLIGGLAVPWTQGMGITFLTTSFGIAAWHLGIALVDILLASIVGQISLAAGVSGGVTTATVISVGMLPIFLGALAGVVCVALALYLAVPLIMASVLRGGSPLTTGAKAGMEMTLTALGLAGMTGARLGAAWAAGSKSSETPSGDHRSGGDEGGEDMGMAPRPSSTSPTGVTSSSKRKTTPSGEADAATDETPVQRQARILAGYEGGKPGQRITPITRLIDQAG
jgi:hypothetical protein